MRPIHTDVRINITLTVAHSLCVVATVVLTLTSQQCAVSEPSAHSGTLLPARMRTRHVEPVAQDPSSAFLGVREGMGCLSDRRGRSGRAAVPPVRSGEERRARQGFAGTLQGADFGAASVPADLCMSCAPPHRKGHDVRGYVENAPVRDPGDVDFGSCMLDFGFVVWQLSLQARAS